MSEPWLFLSLCCQALEHRYFSRILTGLLFAILFSNGSVKVDSELVVRNSSNVTAQQVKQTLIGRNGTNNEGWTLSRIVAKGEYAFDV